MALIETLQKLKDFEKSQVYPSKIRVIPNDKATNKFFNKSQDVYQRLLDGKKNILVEKKATKKKPEVCSYLTIVSAPAGKEPPTEFDRAVLSVCISEWIEGNKITTPAIILRALIGKVAEVGVKLRPDQKAAINNAIDKMLGTVIKLDLRELLKEFNYDEGDHIKILQSAVLPCCRVEAVINGQEVDAIIFDRESPFFTVAEIKNQFVRFNNDLLDVPNQRNTPRIIAIKNYVLLRVMVIKKHKQLQPVLTFDDIFSKCRIKDKHGEIKARARENIIQFFEHLQAQGVISAFEIVKKHNAFYSIKFSYEKNAKILLKNPPKKTPKNRTRAN